MEHQPKKRRREQLAPDAPRAPEPPKQLDYETLAIETGKLETELAKYRDIIHEAGMQIKYPLWQNWKWGGINAIERKGKKYRKLLAPKNGFERVQNAAWRPVFLGGRMDPGKFAILNLYRTWLDERVGENGIEKRLGDVLVTYFGFGEPGDPEKRKEVQEAFSSNMRLVEASAFAEFYEGYIRRGAREVANIGEHLTVMEAAKAFKFWERMQKPKAWMTEKWTTGNDHLIIADDAGEGDIQEAIERRIQMKKDEKARAQLNKQKKAERHQQHIKDKENAESGGVVVENARLKAEEARKWREEALEAARSAQPHVAEIESEAQAEKAEVPVQPRSKVEDTPPQEVLEEEYKIENQNVRPPGDGKQRGGQGKGGNRQGGGQRKGGKKSKPKQKSGNN